MHRRLRGQWTDFGHQPLTADTVVYTASLSKQITAACAALLVQEGRLDTESTLAQWMPDLSPWAGTVRLRHLISHTSGLSEGVEFDELHRAKLDRTTSGVISALVTIDHLAGRPATEYRYGNASYVCLAVVIERAAGLPLPEFGRERVFAPLGMVNSRTGRAQRRTRPEVHPSPRSTRHRCPSVTGESGPPLRSSCAGTWPCNATSWAFPRSCKRQVAWTTAQSSTMRGPSTSASTQIGGSTGTAGGGPG
jgi:CubicO group peptidase (beta-lactamase class C family)